MLKPPSEVNLEGILFAAEHMFNHKTNYLPN